MRPLISVRTRALRRVRLPAVWATTAVSAAPSMATGGTADRTPALKRGTHAELKQLARQIIAAQNREIKVLRKYAGGGHGGGH